MPKIVNHDARRAELAAAMWRVIGRSGMHGASVRAVAAEAGVSPGALRHYFADQMGLVRFAAETMTQRVTERLQGHLDSGLTGRELSRRLLEELLPLDEDRRIEAAVYIEGLTQARQNPALRELSSAGWIGGRHVCRLAFASAKGLPLSQQMDEELEIASDEAAVGLLHTFIDGLTLQGVTQSEQLNPRDMSASLDQFISVLLAGPEA